MEEFSLVKDFAVVMVTAGAATFIFRKLLHLPPIFGYLVAGLLIGPYTFSNPPVENVDEVRLMADLGLVLLLFGLGLEFSFNRIRAVGVTVLLIAAAEILTMLYLGYWLGQALGWGNWSSIFLGSALCITSSGIAVSIIRQSGRMDELFAKLVIGISVAEDFVAIAIIAVLTGIARTGTTELGGGDIGYLVLKLVVFVAALVGFGTLIVPRIIKMIGRLGSREALLITSLGLCFGMALISRELSLSVATGAFLMGSLLGNIDESNQIVEVVTPIEHMFGALYFVAIGMLINVNQADDFIIPAVIIALFFIAGKTLSGTLLTFLSGYDPRTSLRVGMTMPQMGEFSLAIGMVGKQYGVVSTYMYPAVAIASAIVSLFSPIMARSANRLADFFDCRAPAMLKGYISRVSDWLQALRSSLTIDTEETRRAGRALKIIVANGLVVMAIIGAGTFSLSYVKDLDRLSDVRADIIGLVFSGGLLALCMPSFLAIWRNMRVFDDAAAMFLMKRRGIAAEWKYETVRVLLRDGILLVLVFFATLWSLPLISELFMVGSFAVAIPGLLLAIGLFLALRSFQQIQHALEESFGKTLFCGEKLSPGEVSPAMVDYREIAGKLLQWFRRRIPNRRKEY
ncbi:MAG: cation:proton antiporter [Dehalococcoidia bacterium]